MRNLRAFCVGSVIHPIILFPCPFPVCPRVSSFPSLVFLRARQKVRRQRAYPIPLPNLPLQPQNHHSLGITYLYSLRTKSLLLFAAVAPISPFSIFAVLFLYLFSRVFPSCLLIVANSLSSVDCGSRAFSLCLWYAPWCVGCASMRFDGKEV